VAPAAADLRRARPIQAPPAVPALACKLDVDLSLVQASGPDGTVTRADVERAAGARTFGPTAQS
jgi:pyruvate dehydrogenase E2 component (dihydrolipoamide acetyltransferase)